MVYAATTCTSIYFEIYGRGHAVALLHGGGGNGAIWFQQVPTLAERRRVIVLDRRGFGLSRCEPGDLPIRHFADDFRAVPDAAGSMEPRWFAGRWAAGCICCHRPKLHLESQESAASTT